MTSAADTGWREGREQVWVGGSRVGVGALMTVVELRRALGRDGGSGVFIAMLRLDLRVKANPDNQNGDSRKHQIIKHLTSRSWWSAAGQPPPAASPGWSIPPWWQRGADAVKTGNFRSGVLWTAVLFAFSGWS